MNSDLIMLHQERAAKIAIVPSTARKMGPKGTIKRAREFLTALDLRCFRLTDIQSFTKLLDQTTGELKSVLPKGGQWWGSSRKFLNIFLRDVLYNRYLCEHYRLAGLEPWLEIPLDSLVAKKLRNLDELKRLPQWHTVIGLKLHENAQFQNFAQNVADLEGICRVHLDLRFWRGDD